MAEIIQNTLCCPWSDLGLGLGWEQRCLLSSRGRLNLFYPMVVFTQTTAPSHSPHGSMLPPPNLLLCFVFKGSSLSWVTKLTSTECCTHVGAGHSTLTFQGPVIQSCLFPSVPLSSLGISLCVNLLTQDQESQGDQQEGDSRRKSDSYQGNFRSFFPGQYNEAGFIFSVSTLSYLGWKRKKRGRDLCSPYIKLLTGKRGHAGLTQDLSLCPEGL